MENLRVTRTRVTKRKRYTVGKREEDKKEGGKVETGERSGKRGRKVGKREKDK